MDRKWKQENPMDQILKHKSTSTTTILAHPPSYHTCSIIILTSSDEVFISILLHYHPCSLTPSIIYLPFYSINILSPSHIFLNHHPFSVLHLTPLSSLLHYHPDSIIILTPYHADSIIILTPVSFLHSPTFDLELRFQKLLRLRH